MEQFAAILPIMLGNIGKRLASSLVTVVGVAGVVGVLISILAMAQGLHRALAATGRPDYAIILAKGATSESSSNLSNDTVMTAIESAGIKKTTTGSPIVSKAMLVQLRLPQRDGALGMVSVRGIDAAMPLQPAMRLADGRMFRTGRRELMVGHALLNRFPGVKVGQTVDMEGGAWTIVGSFTSDGDAHESELWGDAESLLSAYHRTSFQSVTVALDGPAALPKLIAGLDANPSLGVEAQREDRYYAARSATIIRVLTGIGLLVGGIMAIGAVFAALNTMYAAVASESLSIATLRAIGFDALPVLAAVLVEALLLAIVGAVAGIALAILFFNGHALGADNQAQIFYTMRISPALAITGLVWALAIGMIGGLFPAIRAARLPVAQALREV